jgi:nucleotide-binding universal stress UspA family protein
VSASRLDPSELDLLNALSGGDPLVLAHVSPPAQPAPAPAFEEARAGLEGRGTRVEAVSVVGREPASRLDGMARRLKPDLVVVGSGHHHARLAWGFLSNVPLRLLERSPRSLLVLRSTPKPSARGLLVASGRPGGLFLPTVARVAAATNSTVTALHVEPLAQHDPLPLGLGAAPAVPGYQSISTSAGLGGASATASVPAVERVELPRRGGAPPGDGEGGDGSDGAVTPAALLEDGLAGTVRELSELGVGATPVLRRGPVEEELVREANRGVYWLLAIRARPAATFSRWILGPSFTEDIVRHVPTSVLVLRP